jgi:hypothetical protein
LKSRKSESSAAKSDANRAENGPEMNSIDDLATALLALPKAERLRLANLLLGRDEAKG